MTFHVGVVRATARAVGRLCGGSEWFLSSIVLDGVLERFPGLRISVVELGAVWVPGPPTVDRG